MSGFTVERDWTTAAGFRAVVIMGNRGSRCGYVGVPSGHPLHEVEYGANCAALRAPANDEPIGDRGILPVLCASAAGEFQRPDFVFDVHGGLTYSGGSNDYPAPSDDLWWFGYDCSHAGDAPSDEYCAEQRRLYPDKPYMWGGDDGVHRSLDYCIQQCESLARQIVERVIPAEETESAARLIAAAPELLESLKASATALDLAAKAIGGDLGVLLADRAMFARAAIAKAVQP